MEVYNNSLVSTAWYVLARGSDIKAGQVYSFKILDKDLVVFRSKDHKVVALEDRCPHRNVPLSLGSIQNNKLVCAYHGWSFNESGECEEIPGVVNQHCFKSFLKPFSIEVTNNVVFINLSPNLEITCRPHVPQHLSSSEHVTSYYPIDIDCSYIDLAENFLDPFHTPILHPSLIRSKHKRSKNIISFQQIQNGFEFYYKREKKQSGAFSFLGPKIEKSVGRFLLPSTVELEYFSNQGLEFTNTMYLTPVGKFKTRAHFFVSITKKFPYPLFFKFVGTPILKKVASQDKAMLEQQARKIQQIGQTNYLVYPHSDFSRNLIETLIKNPNGELKFPPTEAWL